MRRRAQIPILAAVVVLLAILIACSGGGSSLPKGSSSPAMVSVTVSDPATCSSASSGPYSNVWVTITDVLIHTSSTAAATDPNWVDLTPNLKNAPQQVDLLAAANNQCFLATLGSNTALQPGTYQQIRIILADNTNNLANNHCGIAGANCIILTPPQTQAPQALLLSSESKTGIKIPSGQIAGGKFMVASGETKDLNIDFDTCASIVVQGNGQFRLKPVLHAGEVALTSVSINGRLVDKLTNAAIVGGKAIVALEQKDTSGVDRVIFQATPDSSGAFNFCPVPAGTYDVVAVAVSGANVAYAATITTGVQPGNALGNIPMIAVTGASTAPGSITGLVTSVNASTPSNGIAIDVMLSALQSAGSGNFTIPVGSQSATLSLATEKPTGCAADPCPPYTASYTMTVPPVSPAIGAFSVTPPTSYTGGNGPPPATYVVEGQAFKPGSGGTADCTLPLQTTAPVSVNPGTPAATAPTLAFTGCT